MWDNQFLVFFLFEATFSNNIIDNFWRYQNIPVLTRYEEDCLYPNSAGSKYDVRYTYTNSNNINNNHFI